MGIPPALEFSGPPELAATWQEFVRHYADRFAADGAAEFQVGSANLFNRLVFGDGAAGMVRDAKSLASEPGDIKARIEDVAQAISAFSKTERGLPLHKAVTSSLVSQWVNLETQHGLYPPVSLGRCDGVSAAEGAQIYERRAALLRSAEGRLLFGAIRMAEDWIVGTNAARVFSVFGGKVELEEIIQETNRQFEDVLFRYETGRGASFETFFYNALNKPTLSKRLMRSICRREQGTGVGVDSESVETLAQVVPDTHEPRPFENMSRDEDLNLIRKQISSLKASERKVIIARFGLADGRERTLDEISHELGVCKERVRQIECEALAKLRKNIASSAGFARGGFDGNGPSKGLWRP